MSRPPLRIAFLGLSITSSWGNGHATTYRGLVRELHARGHDVLFLERDRPWYRENRDLPCPPYGRTALYGSLEELQDRFAGEIRSADLTVVGSFVPEGIAVGEWVLGVRGASGAAAFYDIDTPVTLARLESGDLDYLARDQIPRYDAYFSFTGGPTLKVLESRYGSPRARALLCSVDPDLYGPEPRSKDWDLGYLGTFSEDRQPTLDRLLLEPSRRWPEGRFIVAGPQYPEDVAWPRNVDREIHLSPREHRAFYNAQRFTLNVTRADMVRAGWSPSVRLFEAAACGTPVISDFWPGLDGVFAVGREILVARDAGEVLRHLRDLPEQERLRIGARARARVLASHTSAHRAEQLEDDAREILVRGRAVAR